MEILLRELRIDDDRKTVKKIAGEEDEDVPSSIKQFETDIKFLITTHRSHFLGRSAPENPAPTAMVFALWHLRHCNYKIRKARQMK